MTALDQSPPGSAPVVPAAAPAAVVPAAAPAAVVPAAAPAAVVPAGAARPAALLRDPQERLAALFDPGTLEVLPVDLEERSGVLAGVGLVHGVGAVAFASDAR